MDKLLSGEGYYAGIKVFLEILWESLGGEELLELGGTFAWLGRGR